MGTLNAALDYEGVLKNINLPQLLPVKLVPQLFELSFIFRNKHSHAQALSRNSPVNIIVGFIAAMRAIGSTP